MLNREMESSSAALFFHGGDERTSEKSRISGINAISMEVAF
ncbi:hypothetical protein [Paenibacillus vietnamensis]|nr:hypothetical protein [Paenibacillus vietnamensis]